MSLPNYLARIKSSGIYRFVWDKSVVPTQVAETLRLVVGYSEKGPFNTPVYIDNISDFINIYGDISKKMERKGIFFNRLAIQALANGPILALNLKPFGENEAVDYVTFNGSGTYGLNTINTDPTNKNILPVNNLYDTNRFWVLDEDQLPSKIKDFGKNGKPNGTVHYMNIAATDTHDSACTIFVRKSKETTGYDMTLRQWYSANKDLDMPPYLESLIDTNLKDYFMEIYVFNGKIDEKLFKEKGSPLYNYFIKNPNPKTADTTPYILNPKYTNAFGEIVDTLDALAADSSSNFIGKYKGCTIPYFKDANGNYISIDIKFNADHAIHKMLMKLDENYLYEVDNAKIAEALLPVINNTYTLTLNGTELNHFDSDPEDKVGENGEIIQYVAAAENIYIDGYNYQELNGIDDKMKDGLALQTAILDQLKDKGIYTALTNRIDVEYRYIIDTFKGYIEPGCKAKLSLIAKDKDNAFAILNFPEINQFVKEPVYKSAATKKFDINLIKDKSKGFSLASEAEGASWCAYYTPIKFSDGAVKTYVPSAALVSNNFMDKYGARQPYYIVAGPNYGRINYSGMIGPDYNYGREDLDVLEPMGVNAIIYVPRKGTFINSNQTAKLTPVSGLSKIHIRELVIYLQDEIEAMLLDYQWELNTQTLRDTIKAKADVICERVMNNGGLYAFTNVCDESNNTPEVIDNEMIILDTAIEPARGAGKMVQTLTIHKTGGITSK